ncbi:unnamed protein product [Ixodes pacificus]
MAKGEMIYRRTVNVFELKTAGSKRTIALAQEKPVQLCFCGAQGEECIAVTLRPRTRQKKK